MEKTFTQIIRTNRLSDGEILLNNKKELDEDKKKILIRPNLKHRTTKRKQIFGKENILHIFHHYSQEQIYKKGFEIFKNPERTINDNEYVIELLYNLNPFSRRIKEVEKEHTRDLISKLSFAMKYEYYSKDNVIYRYDDFAEYFYVILSGEVNLLVPNEETIRLTENEYYLYLLNLRKYNEFVLLNKTINKNMEQFPMSERNFDIWIRRAYVTAKEINNNRRIMEEQEKEQKERENNYLNINPPKRFSILNKLPSESPIPKRGSIINSPNSFRKLKSKKSIINEYLPFENEDEIRLALDLYTEVENTVIVMNKPSLINKQIANNVSTKEYINRIKPIYQKDDNLFNVRKKPVLIYNYFKAECIGQGEQFGEMMTDQSFINDDNKRIESVISCNDTHLAILHKDLYNDILRNIIEKSRKHALDFLLNLDIFKYGNKSIFMKNFSTFFKRRNLYYKDILYKENGIIDNNHVIYFIKNGQFSTIAKKSLQEIDKILLKSSLKRNINKHEIDKLEILKDYVIKKDIKFESFGKNDILGLGDCGIENKYLYTLFCNSPEATVFEIHITFFKMLLNLDKTILEKAKEIQKIKSDILLKLLYKQRESLLNFMKSKLKDNNLFDNNNNIEKLKYSKKNCVIKLKVYSDENNEKNNNKKKNKILPILSDSNIFERKIQKRIESSNSINKFKKHLKDGLEIDLLMRDQTTQTNINSLNKTNNNFLIINNNLNESLNSKDKNIFQKTYFEKMMKRKIENENKKKFNFELSDKYSNNFDTKFYSFSSSKNHKYINPLIYDDFERKYNTIKYFDPSKENNNSDSYKIHFNSNLIEKRKKRINDDDISFSDSKLQKTKRLMNFKTIDYSTIKDFRKGNHKELNQKLKNIYYNNRRFKKLFKILNNDNNTKKMYNFINK